MLFAHCQFLVPELGVERARRARAAGRRPPKTSFFRVSLCCVCLSMHVALLLIIQAFVVPRYAVPTCGPLRATGTRLIAEGDDARPALSWQEELEKLLSPRTANADREMLFRDLLSKGPEIFQEVTAAAATGDLTSIVPPESDTRKVLEDVQRLSSQVIEDVLPEAANEAQQLLGDPARLSETFQRAVATAQDASRVSSALLADPERALSLLQQEAMNAVSRSPVGVETPPFTLLSRKAGYEVRRYDSYGVAAISIEASRAIGLEGTVRGFGALGVSLWRERGRRDAGVDGTAAHRRGRGVWDGRRAPIHAAPASPLAHDGASAGRGLCAAPLARRSDPRCRRVWWACNGAGGAPAAARASA